MIECLYLGYAAIAIARITALSHNQFCVLLNAEAQRLQAESEQFTMDISCWGCKHQLHVTNMRAHNVDCLLQA